MKFESKNCFCTCVTHVIMIICSTEHFVSTQSDFQLNTDFPSQFCVFTVKSPSVTQKKKFLKKMLLKRAKTFSFSTKLWTQIILIL